VNHRRLLIFMLTLLLGGADVQAATVIKIGSIAPDRSPWDKALQEVALDWAKISNGAVELKIYAGGIAGSELDMLRKMRLGTLGGAVFTAMGMVKIDRDVFVLSTPFLWDSEQEFQYVFEKIKPVFRTQIEEKGFKVLLWTQAGWAYFFTKGKVVYPDDLKNYKISFTTGEPEMEQAWKKMGYQIVPNDLKDLMIGLQSGLVDAFYLPPLLAASGQYFALAPHMLGLPLAPLIGGLVLTDKAWESVPEAYREPMEQALVKVGESLYQSTKDLDNEAIKTMQENGLGVEKPPADALEKWRAAAAMGIDELTEKAFSKKIYEQVLALIREFRQKSGR
jgi:TRAP-type C4-dicarboxylate transport system substrate-binding protein